jgi:hypothetical protein
MVRVWRNDNAFTERGRPARFEIAAGTASLHGCDPTAQPTRI